MSKINPPSVKKQKIMVQNISTLLPENSKLGGLFLGNIFGAQNCDILKQYGIRTVLSLSTQAPIKYDQHQQDIPFHLKIQAHDKDDYDIIQNDFQKCYQFIETYRKYTNVLVHCYAGVSRSVTIVVAYFMKKYNWSLEKSLSFVKFKRCVAKPNKGFLQQLIKYQNKLKSIKIQKKKQQTLKIKKKITQNQQKNYFIPPPSPIPSVKSLNKNNKEIQRLKQSKPTSITSINNLNERSSNSTQRNQHINNNNVNKGYQPTGIILTSNSLNLTKNCNPQEKINNGSLISARPSVILNQNHKINNNNSQNRNSSFYKNSIKSNTTSQQHIKYLNTCSGFKDKFVTAFSEMNIMTNRGYNYQPQNKQQGQQIRKTVLGYANRPI